MKLISSLASLSIILYCISLSVNAQDKDAYYKEMQARHAKTFGYDPEFRVNYSENIALRANFFSDIATYQFKNLNTGQLYELNPVAESLIGVAMDYKWFSLGLSFGPKFLLTNIDQELQEKSQSFKFDLNAFYSDQWGQTFTLLFNRGFNVTSFNTELNNDLNALKNTEFQFYGGSTFFIINENFSYRAYKFQTERQLKSAGSFVPKLSYSYSVTNPNITEPVVILDIDKIKSLDIIADIGYYHTFVHNKTWYLTLAAQPGIGYNSSRYHVINSTNKNFDSLSFALNVELGIGYNSYRWFFGVLGNWRNYNNTNNEQDQINRDSAYFKIHLGYRLNDNKPMRNFFGWFEKLLGIEY